MFTNKGCCYCSSCITRDLYIKIYYKYIKIGGNLKELENKSIINKIVMEMIQKN